ncbi:hypothetical protein D3C72_2487970 [compost metagenome]
MMKTKTILRITVSATTRPETANSTLSAAWRMRRRLVAIAKASSAAQPRSSSRNSTGMLCRTSAA